MLGCKFVSAIKTPPLKYRINRYMLGCKYIMLFIPLVTFIELIDTCWDVNYIRIV